MRRYAMDLNVEGVDKIITTSVTESRQSKSGAVSQTTINTTLLKLIHKSRLERLHLADKKIIEFPGLRCDSYINCQKFFPKNYATKSACYFLLSTLHHGMLF
jgi:hypothetical protein